MNDWNNDDQSTRHGQIVWVILMTDHQTPFEVGASKLSHLRQDTLSTVIDRSKKLAGRLKSRITSARPTKVAAVEQAERLHTAYALSLFG
jgi:hypothetical protein